MVQDTGKTLYVGTFKSLNLPELLYVEEDHLGLPMALKSGKKQRILAIEDTWRLDDEWWRAAPLSRMYFTVTLVSGHRLVIFKDLMNNRWYCQTY
jgi:hypothetical protein